MKNKEKKKVKGKIKKVVSKGKVNSQRLFNTVVYPVIFNHAFFIMESI